MATSPICLTTRPPYKAKPVFQTRLSVGVRLRRSSLWGSREYCRFSAGGGSPCLRLGREWLKDVAVPTRSRKGELAQVRAAGLEADSRVFEMWVTDKAVRKSVTEAALRRTN